MTLEECYNSMGGDYEDVMKRLRSERMVQKFVLKFLEDESYNTLQTALQDGNAETAFRAAHTIKGMCLNLGFARLGHSSSILTEALRSGDLEKGRELYENVRADYVQTADAIRIFKSGLSE